MLGVRGATGRLGVLVDKARRRECRACGVTSLLPSVHTEAGRSRAAWGGQCGALFLCGTWSHGRRCREPCGGEVPRAVTSGRWRRAWVGRRELTTPRVPRWRVGPAAWAGGVGGLLWGASVGGVPRRLGPQYHPGSLGPRTLRRVPGWQEVQGAAGKAGCASRAAWSGSFLLIRPRFPLVGGPRAPAGPSPQKAGSTAAGREGGKAPRAAGDLTLLSGLVAAGDREPFWTCRC